MFMTVHVFNRLNHCCSRQRMTSHHWATFLLTGARTRSVWCTGPYWFNRSEPTSSNCHRTAESENEPGSAGQNSSWLLFTVLPQMVLTVYSRAGTLREAWPPSAWRKTPWGTSTMTCRTSMLYRWRAWGSGRCSSWVRCVSDACDEPHWLTDRSITYFYCLSWRPLLLCLISQINLRTQLLVVTSVRTPTVFVSGTNMISRTKRTCPDSAVHGVRF